MVCHMASYTLAGGLHMHSKAALDTHARSYVNLRATTSSVGGSLTCSGRPGWPSLHRVVCGPLL